MRLPEELRCIRCRRGKVIINTEWQQVFIPIMVSELRLMLKLRLNFVQLKNLHFCVQVPVKKRCPYMEKCYRKNPIHFNEMSHPHREYK